MAADNCDPNVCGKIMGCGLSEVRFQTTQIDTMAVKIIVNTNDCQNCKKYSIYNQINISES